MPAAVKCDGQDVRTFMTTTVEGVGGYGVQIIFQDGDDRGGTPGPIARVGGPRPGS